MVAGVNPVQEKTMKRPVLTFFAIFLLGHISQRAQAQGWCSNADVAGSYAGQLRGSFLNIPGVDIRGPIGRVAIVQLDGSGNLNVPFERGVYVGIPASQPFAGTYAVAPDCTIQLVAIPPPPLDFPVPFAGALSNDKRQFSVIIVGPGASVEGEFERMNVNGCTNRTLTGGYAMQLEGTVLSPAPAAGPYRASGRLEFDGAGSVRAAGVASTNGIAAPLQFTGTYSVASECSLSISYSAGGVDYKMEGVIGDSGRKVVLLQTAPLGTAVVTGVLRNQAGRASGF